MIQFITFAVTSEYYTGLNIVQTVTLYSYVFLVLSPSGLYLPRGD